MIHVVDQDSHKYRKCLTKSCRSNHHSAVSPHVPIPGPNLEAKRGITQGFKIAIDDLESFTMYYLLTQFMLLIF
ncbi:hypothetical protein D3C79_369120 [compost metagenome]